MKYEREMDFLFGLFGLNMINVGIFVLVLSFVPYKYQDLVGDFIFPIATFIAIQSVIWLAYIIVKKNKDLTLLWVGNGLGMFSIMILAILSGGIDNSLGGFVLLLAAAVFFL